MKPVLKSLAAALVGMALFFCFFMMSSMLVLIYLQHSQTTFIIEPAKLFRAVGLPLSAVVFVMCFLLAMKKFRTGSEASTIGHR